MMTSPDRPTTSTGRTRQQAFGKYATAIISNADVTRTRKVLLTRDEEVNLIRRAQGGDRSAMQELVSRNEGLVTTLAKHNCNPSFPFEDAFQEGSLGLLEAIRRFDTNSGCRLSTYATPWIMQKMARGRHSTEDLVRLPSHIKEAQAKLWRARQRHLVQHGEEPTDEQLAFSAEMPVKEVQYLFSVSYSVISLDEPAHRGDGDAPDNLLIDYLVDPVPGPDSDIRLEQLDLKQMAAGILALLDAPTRDLLLRRFGFPPYDGPQSIQQIGDALGFSRQAIQQREKKALRRVRHILGMTADERDNRQQREARDREVLKAVQAGETIKSVAVRFNVQARRVRQIVKQMSG